MVADSAFAPKPQPYGAPAASHRYVLDQVRRTDSDRFLGALFAPELQRRDLLAILAFDHELERTRTVTKEPLLAAIRLQWWREAVIEAAGDGRPRAQPLVEALSETARRHGLSAEPFERLIVVREEEVEGALDVRRAGGALADLELLVLGVDHAPTREAAQAVATARLTHDHAERAGLLAKARARRRVVDPKAMPVLLPALALDARLSPWRRPLVYWWGAKSGRY